MPERMSRYSVKRRRRQLDNFCCTGCGLPQEINLAVCGQQLHVHRRIPGSAYTVEGTTSLCLRCHSQAHGRHLEERVEVLVRLSPRFLAALVAAARRTGKEYGELLEQAAGALLEGNGAEPNVAA